MKGSSKAGSLSLGTVGILGGITFLSYSLQGVE